MEKCWFILRQSHYPPPQDGIGPIQLGHIIPDLRRLDQVINATPGPYPYPRGIAIYKSRQEIVKSKIDNNDKASLSSSVLVPIPQAAGLVSVGGRIGYAFQRSVARYWEFDALDISFIQPTRAYIEDCLGEDAVKMYIDRHRHLNSWSLYMVTGLTVARGAKAKREDKKRDDISIAPSVSVASVVDGDVELLSNRSNSVASSFERSSDFIWSIRLTKLSKKFYSRDWDHESYTKGATYGLEDEQNKEDIKQFLSSQAIDSSQILEVGDDIFVLTDPQTG
ncbi:hypothetical protein BGW36DRAFT_464809 [Talaromyces proteolyticus]|uniref:Uncharacterized protein n=1 Tax=Talaromyces proteolyticus TaxID=1131652 RepID=A0AAD4KIA6_9EURO|nr:uncharacterized protein BGW36DRAFT_464809 [Talaromyces proteolyticus]KAH8692295.1 hypothetical protein BGW36DRAFT_464809 [Talaromyces proteolyticus]